MRLRTTLVATVILSSATLWASDYLTHGVDPGRTGWMKDEKVFNTTNVRNMKLLWKVKLDTKTRAMHNLFNPLIVEKVTTPQGTREMALVAGVNDDLFGIDVANGQQLWHQQFDNVLPEALLAPVDNVLCPGGLTDVPVDRPGPDARQLHRCTSISWDGRLRQVDLATGQDMAPPEKFLPGNGKPYALNLVNGVIYTASAQGCGGQPNAFYSFDLATKKASIFQPAGGGFWGRRGDAIDPEGRVYIGTGDARFDPTTRSLGNGIVAVKIDANKQLQLADLLRAEKCELAAAPRSRRERDADGVRLQGHEVPRRHEQGVPAVAARPRQSWRRGPSNAALHLAAHLQRHPGVRRQGHLGIAVDAGRTRAARSGCSCRSGAR